MSKVSLIDGHIGNGMSDNDIIKALERCLEDRYEHCSKCPYYDKVQCTFELMSDVLDITNRQKAEIERLQDELSKKEEIIKRLCEEGD